MLDAAHRRLAEEIGLEADTLEVAGRFKYEATSTSSGLVGAELDHVVLTRTDAEPQLDPTEADAYLWIEPAELHRYLDGDELPVAPGSARRWRWPPPAAAPGALPTQQTGDRW